MALVLNEGEVEGEVGVEQGSHIVHFYADDFELAASIARYAADGLDAGQAVVVIAKPAHIASVRDALVAMDVDPDSGNVHWFDASATLGQFLEDGLLDRDRFAEVVGGTLRAAGTGRAGVRAYGEMVEILWQRGDVTGALDLEASWNDLARELSFSLYCAYRENVVAQGAQGALDEACRLHSAVVADGAHRSRQSSSAHFAASDDAPAEARAFVLGKLRDGRDHELACSAVLTVSELATNAVRYGGTGFTVTITRLTNRVRISVCDRSLELPALGPADRTGVSGRGLHIVDALSREWGAEPRCDGKVVWAELDCA